MPRRKRSYKRTTAPMRHSSLPLFLHTERAIETVRPARLIRTILSPCPPDFDGSTGNPEDMTTGLFAAERHLALLSKHIFFRSPIRRVPSPCGYLTQQGGHFFRSPIRRVPSPAEHAEHPDRHTPEACRSLSPAWEYLY